MKITIIGLGYVGLSLGLLLSQKYKVIAYDNDEKKIHFLEKKKSPIADNEIEEFLSNNALNFFPTSDKIRAFKDSDYYIIATPTNYDLSQGSFDTSSVLSVTSEIININPDAFIVIKSTVPIGFTDTMRSKFATNRIFFSPEFLRESKSLYDNLFPSRIIVGDTSKAAKTFADMLAQCSRINNKVKIISMTSKEAESVKLFSNTFLAMRISFFNELDSFAEMNSISTLKIIDGICSDPRIGNHYNNPSFGYGGYCLPKDTQQLVKNFSNIPNSIIKAVVESNTKRKEFIAKMIIAKHPKVVGIHRLIMKKNSDNFRESAVFDVIEILKNNNIDVIIFEPFIKENKIYNLNVINQLDEFISRSDIIVTNRMSSELENVKSKVYTRDLFQEN
mgnify:CR=1 FL=1